MPAVSCDQCGTQTYKKPSQVAKHPHHFCGSACFYAWNQRGNHFRFGRVALRCGFCGVSFERQQRFVRRGSGKSYCSIKCHAEGKRRTFQTSCEWCGASLIRHRCRAKYNHQFCNARCKSQWASHHRSGSASWAWRGGAEPYYGPSWGRQKVRALRRDGYTCQECGANKSRGGRKPDVHHIVPFRKFGYVKDVNDKHLLANALSNLRTLCRLCHTKAEPKTLTA
jgi:5-methylcytosine-specific restriction endonuclease McrA